TPLIAGAMGIHMPAEGSHAAPGEPHPSLLWPRLIAFIIGCVAGFFVAGLINWLLAGFFKGFNWAFDTAIAGYGKIVLLLIRTSLVVLLIYAGLMAMTYVGFTSV